MKRISKESKNQANKKSIKVNQLMKENIVNLEKEIARNIKLIEEKQLIIEEQERQLREALSKQVGIFSFIINSMEVLISDIQESKQCSTES